MMGVESASAQKDAEPVRHETAGACPEAALAHGYAGASGVEWLGHELMSHQARRGGSGGRGVVQRSTATLTRIEAGSAVDMESEIIELVHERTRSTPDPYIVQANPPAGGWPGGKRHCIPYNWLRDICRGFVAGAGRRVAYARLSDFAEYLEAGRAVALGGAMTRRDYDGRLDDVIQAICNWRGNLYRGLGSGDDSGRQLDIPLDETVKETLKQNAERVWAAAGRLPALPTRRGGPVVPERVDAIRDFAAGFVVLI